MSKYPLRPVVLASRHGHTADGRKTRLFGRRGSHEELQSYRVEPVRARILVVDDHKLTRIGIRAAVADTPGWEICGEALDGIEAVELTLQLKPDLIVMDILMPTMSGIEAARQIRKISPQTKIVMLSVYDAPSIHSFVKQAGADAFLSKVRSSGYLHETIAKLLSESPWLTADG